MGDEEIILEYNTSYSEPGYTAKDNYDGDLYDDLRDRNKTFRISIMQTERIVYSDRTSWTKQCTNPLVDGINTFDDFKTINIEEKVE